LTLIIDGSGIVTKNSANDSGQYFDYGLLPLHSPWIMQDARTMIILTPLTLSFGGSSIVTNNIANKGSQYFDYGLLPLHSPWIMLDSTTQIVNALLMFISRMA